MGHQRQESTLRGDYKTGRQAETPSSHTPACVRQVNERRLPDGSIAPVISPAVTGLRVAFQMSGNERSLQQTLKGISDWWDRFRVMGGAERRTIVQYGRQFVSQVAKMRRFDITLSRTADLKQRPAEAERGAEDFEQQLFQERQALDGFKQRLSEVRQASDDFERQLFEALQVSDDLDTLVKAMRGESDETSTMILAKLRMGASMGDLAVGIREYVPPNYARIAELPDWNGPAPNGW